MHRDLKLDNLLLDEHDRILLADFGFADHVNTTTAQHNNSVAQQQHSVTTACPPYAPCPLAHSHTWASASTVR